MKNKSKLTRDIPLRLFYRTEAPYGNEYADRVSSTSLSAIEANKNDGWERWSLPIGNGYFGVNVFGRTETERLQITEKTLANPYNSWHNSLGGLNNFSETYIDFGHPFDKVTDYCRSLDLCDAVARVEYNLDGVKYSREYFCSYPDRTFVIYLSASREGALSFTLRPTVPYRQEYACSEGDGASKSGEVVSRVENLCGIIELSGKLGYYDIDFLGKYRVFVNGGKILSDRATDRDGYEGGTIRVTGATEALITVNLGTDYVLSPEVFLSDDAHKPTRFTDLNFTRGRVEGDCRAIFELCRGMSVSSAYRTLLSRHVEDYSTLFGRVSLELPCSAEELALPTDELIERYRLFGGGYLETLYFQYGRYLLIASSRAGALPANLQGTWNRYRFAPWSSGYWHNINVQMNYWPAFSTNLRETFAAYEEYSAAYMDAAVRNADRVILENNPDKYDGEGNNGWCIGTGGFPYRIGPDRSAGNLGFTTQLFWECYQYTKDVDLLRDEVYPRLREAARFITKCVEEDDEGHYLVSKCDSPEMHVNGVWHYTKGTTYAQSFCYLNNSHLVEAARDLGIDLSHPESLAGEDAILSTVLEQLNKYDPILIGLSGQIKEFREEGHYCSIGDEPQHRHISHLVGLYPGDIITPNTPEWMEAARYTLNRRGNRSTGWAVAHRLNLWARAGDGEMAREILKVLLCANTAPNLWDLHPPFQIDGNLGGVSGIAEMLMQSHAGFIHPLPALPEEWNRGSFDGLVARGAFTVGMDWSDGRVDEMRLYSQKGGEVAVLLGDGYSVAAEGEERVSVKADGRLLRFNTEAGESYRIFRENRE